MLCNAWLCRHQDAFEWVANISSGWAPGREDTDFPSGGFSAQLLVRSLQPSGTTISR